MIKDDIKADSSKVICPKCCHQFTAICLNDQKERSRALAEIERLEAMLAESAKEWHRQDKEVDAVEAERYAALADARRYRWLRNDAQNDTSESAPLVFDCTCDGGVRFTLVEDALDAAIDAAIAKGEAQ